MTSDLTGPKSALVARAAHYGASTIQDDTIKRYASIFSHFEKWCDRLGLSPLPPEPATVACYLAALADGAVRVDYEIKGKAFTSQKPYKFSTIQQVYTGLIQSFRGRGYEWPQAQPAIVKVMHGIAVRKGTRKRKMEPLKVDDLRNILGSLRERRFEDLTVIRDRALLSLCFFGALRRGELVKLKVEDLTFTDEGLVVLIRKSKEDPTSEGQEVGILPQKDPRVCPIALLRDWLEKSETKAGWIFRRIDRNGCMGNRPLTGQGFALLVKAHVERVGLDPENFAGHSLRAGFATTAAKKGVGLPSIMRQGRWKDQRVAMTYIRPATVLEDNATEGLSDDDE